jgi:hypothetical protein
MRSEWLALGVLAKAPMNDEGGIRGYRIEVWVKGTLGCCAVIATTSHSNRIAIYPFTIYTGPRVGVSEY